MNILLIAIIFLVGLVALTKFSHLRSHLFYKTIAVIFVLFLASAAYVYLSSGISLATYNGFLDFGKAYYSWLGNLFGNVGSISGYAVKQDWGVNSTISP